MPEIARILCPVDFSEASAHAIDLAIALAGWCRARITALHVCNPAYMPVPGLPPPAERVPPAEVQRAHDEILKCFRPATAAGIGVDAVVDVGQPVRHILSRAIHSSADLIVMGTHGASGFEHLVLGSVTEKVLRRATCAVLTVPPRAHATSKLPFARVLCAVDFSDPSLAALHLAQSLACDAHAALTVMHVIEWPWDEPPAPDFTQLPKEQAAALAEYRRYVETTATGRLSTLLPEPVQQRCAAHVRVSHGKSYVEILRVAGDERADLIVMGVHGRNAIDMMLFGSTTNQVVRRATCPVLTLRK
ncbi:MAG: universal stress protein [Acidobacteriia bacterium]|nr:universal stress protein [Terriglobia bacterium]